MISLSDFDRINQAKRAISNGSDPKDAWYIITQAWLLSDDADYAEGLEPWEKLKPRILNEAKTCD